MDSERKYLIVGNWKMNLTNDQSERLLKRLDKRLGQQEFVQTLVAPSYTALAQAANILRWSRIGVAAQDMSEHESGAFTGDVSAQMLLTAGCKGVILGHSERRAVHSESDDLIGRKLTLAFSSGLFPIVCVGETESERDAGQTDSVLTRQLGGAFPESVDSAILEEQTDFALAYEPVWAIGTGKVATPEIAEAAHTTLRSWIATRFDEKIAARIRILYGGSVKPDNSAGLLSREGIDGALVGGCSLKSDEFADIVQSVPGYPVKLEVGN